MRYVKNLTWVYSITRLVHNVISARVTRSPTKNVFVRRSLFSFVRHDFIWFIAFSVSCLLYCLKPSVGKTQVQAEGTISFSQNEMYSLTEAWLAASHPPRRAWFETNCAMASDSFKYVPLDSNAGTFKFKHLNLT